MDKKPKTPVKTLSFLVLFIIFAIFSLLGHGVNQIRHYSNHNATIESAKQAESKKHDASQVHNQPTQAQCDQALAGVKNQIKGTITYNGHGAYLVNNSQSTLNPKVEHTQFAANTTDKQGRPSVANAFLTRHSRQYQNREMTHNGRTNWVPKGWHQVNHLNGTYKQAYNRGHLLGYALVGNIPHFDASEANHQNIVTQTAWANQANATNDTGQNYYESLVRKALDQNKQVAYQVTPLYQNDNPVPSAIHLQAKSTDGQLNFNVIVPNVQGNIDINYQTGQATPNAYN